MNKKSSSHISLLVHGCFNVPCYKPHPDPDQEEEESWSGSKVRLNQIVRFKVNKVDFGQKIPYIRGELVTESVAEYKMSSAPLSLDLSESGSLGEFGDLEKALVKAEIKEENKVNKVLKFEKKKKKTSTIKLSKVSPRFRKKRKRNLLKNESGMMKERKRKKMKKRMARMSLRLKSLLPRRSGKERKNLPMKPLNTKKDPQSKRRKRPRAKR